MSSNKDLKKSLTKLQYHVTQEHGTEAPFSGELNDCKEEGIYQNSIQELAGQVFLIVLIRTKLILKKILLI